MRSVKVDATGKNIKTLMKKNNLCVSDLQEEMGFTTPQAIYKWFRGESMPTIDNLVILTEVLEATLDEIVVYESLN